MDAARILREARQRAGLTQAELGGLTRMLQPAVARLEAGAQVPRVDTLERMLRACGRTLTTEPRWAAGVDRTRIRALQALDPLSRLHGDTAPSLRPLRILRLLVARHADFVLVGPAAARMHGAPMHLDRIDIVAQPGATNALRLRGALARLRSWRIGVGRVVVRRALGTVGSYELLRRAASRIPVGRYTVLVASIDDLVLLAAARDERALLSAVREEQERVEDPDRRTPGGDPPGVRVRL